VLAAVRDAAEREGYQVRGLAPTSRAAQKLGEAGMPTMTLQRHLGHHTAAGGERTLRVCAASTTLAG
jgi:hypothetical protein